MEPVKQRVGRIRPLSFQEEQQEKESKCVKDENDHLKADNGSFFDITGNGTLPHSVFVIDRNLYAAQVQPISSNHHLRTEEIGFDFKRGKHFFERLAPEQSICAAHIG